MPKQKLSVSQMMTIGAKTEAILVVPRGCIKNSRTKMAQVVPTMVALLMFSFTVSSLIEIRKFDAVEAHLPLNGTQDRLCRSQNSICAANQQ